MLLGFIRDTYQFRVNLNLGISNVADVFDPLSRVFRNRLHCIITFRVLFYRYSFPILFYPFPGVHGIVNARCSVEYPWLLKQGNMQGLGLHDIEMGRIIGRFTIDAMQDIHLTVHNLLILCVYHKIYLASQNSVCQ